jgi:hypothetical protein
MRHALERLVGRRILVTPLAALMGCALFGVAGAGGPLNKDSDNIAIKGYDTVAYFTEGRAVKGDSGFELAWRDARWLFANEKHRAMFAEAPERYAPQFGGLCAGAVTRGVVVKADPEAWTIVDGRLYMKVSKASRDEWRKNAEENIQEANEAWAKMKQND